MEYRIRKTHNGYQLYDENGNIDYKISSSKTKVWSKLGNLILFRNWSRIKITIEEE